MITMPAHALWVLLAVWMAVIMCAFLFGWYASAYKSGEAAEAARRRAIRRHPSARYQPDPLPRAGRLPVSPDMLDLEPPLVTTRVRQPDPAQWWPALERHARADTAPFSRVETSNWEAAKRRDMDAWLHERGMQ